MAGGSTLGYALLRDGVRVGNVHSTREAAQAEAYSRGAVVRYSVDFADDPGGLHLAHGYAIVYGHHPS